MKMLLVNHHDILFPFSGLAVYLAALKVQSFVGRKSMQVLTGKVQVHSVH